MKFEEWKKLFETDPEAFEKKRQEEIEKAIAEARPENQNKLRQLQWIIDEEIKKSGNPLTACAKLNGMIIKQLNAQLNALKMLLKMLGNPKKLRIVK